MKTNIQDKELDALFQKVLPPEEYGEDSNVEELYNRIMDLETELEKFKVSSHETDLQGANSGQLQQHDVSGALPPCCDGCGNYKAQCTCYENSKRAFLSGGNDR